MQRATLLSAFFALVTLMFAGAASANIINLNTVAIGSSGSLPGNFTGSPLGNSGAYGFLPSNSQITFTYTFTPSPVLGILGGYGSYDYTMSGTHYNGSSTATTGLGTITTGYTNGVASSPLVFATANLTTLAGTTTGIVTITNLSSGLAQFQSLFYGILGSPVGITGLTYNVSSVPLPAALPMFGALIASLFGFRQLRKQRNDMLAVAA